MPIGSYLLAILFSAILIKYLTAQVEISSLFCVFFFNLKTRATSYSIWSTVPCYPRWIKLIIIIIIIITIIVIIINVLEL